MNIRVERHQLETKVTRSRVYMRMLMVVYGQPYHLDGKRAKQVVLSIADATRRQNAWSKELEFR